MDGGKEEEEEDTSGADISILAKASKMAHTMPVSGRSSTCKGMADGVGIKRWIERERGTGERDRTSG